MGALALIQEAKERGVHVLAEVLPQYLMLNTDDLIRLAGFARCAPALREQAEVDGIWGYVLNGTIDLVCSDHCPYTVESKQAGHDDIFRGRRSGSPATDPLAGVLLRGGCGARSTVERFVSLIAANPGTDLRPLPSQRDPVDRGRRGHRLARSNAIWTVTVTDALHKQKWTPYEGKEITGRVVRTMRRGETIFDDSCKDTTADPRPSRVRQVPAPRIWRDDVTLNLDANGRWIDPRRVESSIQELSQYGAHGETGVARLVYSPEWVAAQDQVAGWMEEAGLRVERDAAGNVWGLSRRPRPRAAHRGHRLTHRQSKSRRAF